MSLICGPKLPHDMQNYLATVLPRDLESGPTERYNLMGARLNHGMHQLRDHSLSSKPYLDSDKIEP